MSTEFDFHDPYSRPTGAPKLPARPWVIGFGIFVLIASWCTYFRGYEQPAAFFWDENYHIVAAQKYLGKVFFMEPHPPLGKLLIALGEWVVDANEKDDQFISTDYGKNLPDGFSFQGYRLFPVLLAWLAALQLYLLLYVVLRNELLAVFGTFFYIFDNALLVHLRGAMLEGPLVFFFFGTLLGVALVHRYRPILDEKVNRWYYIGWAWLGLSFGALMATKITGVLLLALVPGVLWVLRKTPRSLFRGALLGLGCAVVVYSGVWEIHFALGQRIIPELPQTGFYQATDQLKQVLSEGKGGSIANFPLQLANHVNFFFHYQTGVPRLDLCKPDENGSPWFLWPMGGRSINYRWQKDGEKLYRYLYLQVNPAVWWLSFGGVLAAFGLLFSAVVKPTSSGLAASGVASTGTGSFGLKQPFWLFQCSLVYFAYLLQMGRIDRVMYLYHYFPPLLLSFVLFVLVVNEIDFIGRWHISEDVKVIFFFSTSLLVFFGFWAYHKFTYYLPISNEEVSRRAISEYWGLHCVGCIRSNPVAVPRESTIKAPPTAARNMTCPKCLNRPLFRDIIRENELPKRQMCYSIAKPSRESSLNLKAKSAAVE